MLWDIDHTLIETAGLGSRFYRAAFETITNREMVEQADVTGKTEQAILTETLRMHRIEPTDDHQKRYAVELARQYEQHADLLRNTGRALPGAGQALTALAAVPGTVQTVLTGNLREVAFTKLRVFDLATPIDFEVGAYGEDDSERAKLVPVAQDRAGAKYRTRFDDGNTVIIGDTTSDVTAARQGGAQIVAVASGRDSEDELRRAGADRVIPDLIETQRLVDAVQEALMRGAD
ncbi:HAD family hydrolase [Planosporangium sp. 12N6]|uniref:HAD family hydrolase n=1 Tax=Planosporangium spinosum TaxID=3402278 RepID=UPI003CF1650A